MRLYMNIPSVDWSTVADWVNLFVMMVSRMFEV